MKKSNEKKTNEDLFNYGLILYAFGAVAALTLPLQLGEPESKPVARVVKPTPVLAACAETKPEEQTAALAQPVSAKAEVGLAPVAACPPVAGSKAPPIVAPAVTKDQTL